MQGGTPLQMSLAALAAIVAPAEARAENEAEREAVAELDIAFQAAVKRNDAEAMALILHRDFIMVLGDGRVVSREQLLAGAASGAFVYEQQDEVDGTQTVRLWGDTAVVTALLWVKGTHNGAAFDRHVWFSDTYVRTEEGWRYAFAQVSLPVPQPPS